MICVCIGLANGSEKEEIARISVVRPAFNQAAYIREALGSVFAQTYNNYEIIVINEGSTDHTESILQPYLVDRQIRYVYQSNQELASHGISE